MNKKIKGSAIVVVMLVSIAFSVYVTSTYLEQEHFNLLQTKYEKNLKDIYEKDINNIQDYYNKVLENIK